MTTALAIARQPLPLSLKLIYAAGQTGNVMTYQIITTYVLSFYSPPEGKGAALIPAFLLGAFSTYFLLNVLARGFDTFWDPIVANWSDRSTSRLGRRRVFMLAGVLPLALTAGLLFFPPDQGSSLANVVWLGVVLTAYYASFSVYVAPYLALLPELAPEKDESTSLSTLQAAAGLLGALLVMVVAPALFGAVAGAGRGALQTMVAAMAALSFLLMALPVLFLDEGALSRRPPGAQASHLGLFASLRETLSDRAFLPYVAGYTLFFFGFNIVSTGATFYVEVLMRGSLFDVAKVLGPMFGVAGLSFPFIGLATRRSSKKAMMVFAAAALAVLMAFVPFVRDLGHGMLLFALAGIPVAIFMAIPNAMVADISSASARRTGERREAMFFGAQGFLQKISLGISTGLFSWVKDAFGSSVEHPTGVQLTGPLTSAVLVLAAIAFAFYPEARVTREMGEDG
ncbi:MFS transporter [Polyangium aurulentum]|uniref:MFS transporter n=1 Tax=Polyangium aurulentum TaxID=2567896 RepID=UPI0010AE131B|nr:MFS transporter [Polyangium aurulentum]UQA59031.1 MFS transporter [Polyangium aurulentum]